MKTKFGILALAFSVSFFSLQAQRSFRTTTTTRAVSYDISDNLDLDAVASIFGDSENLEDFEYRLNNPETRISNLDLNEDGYVDYLRVIENSSEQNSLVIIQAVLDDNIYQDVATVEVERVQYGNPRIQVVGDAYLYGRNYIIEPVYVRTPLIFSFFWGPRYKVWHSPYHWSHYPNWYEQCRPYSPFKYQRYVYGHINKHNIYNYSDTHYHYFNDDRYQQIRRNDYASRHPERAFEKRQNGYSNIREYNEQRPENTTYRRRSEIQRNTGAIQNTNSYDRERVRSTNERSSYQYQAPANKSTERTDRNVQQTEQRTGSSDRTNVESTRTRTRNTNSNQETIKNTNSPNGSVQIRTEPGRETTSPLPVTRSRTRDSERSTNQVEQNTRSTQNEKASSAGNSNNRSNRETRLQQRTAKKAEEKKDGKTEERRRTE